jgi:SAM-dependent methyltransferase
MLMLQERSNTTAPLHQIEKYEQRMKVFGKQIEVKWFNVAHLGSLAQAEQAIDFARSLSHETGIPATFHRMDIYEWFEEAARGLQRFDLAFCSYGVTCWLSDVQAWAKGIATILTAGGRFVLIDYHPVARRFTWDLRRQYSYFTNGEPLTFEQGLGDYVALSGQELPGMLRDIKYVSPSGE